MYSDSKFLRRRGASGSLTNQLKADHYASRIGPLVFEIMCRSRRYWKRHGLAAELNHQGIPTSRGGKWFPITAHRLLMRLGPDFMLEVQAETRRREQAEMAELMK